MWDRHQGIQGPHHAIHPSNAIMPISFISPHHLISQNMFSPRTTHRIVISIIQYCIYAASYLHSYSSRMAYNKCSKSQGNIKIIV
ncbi:unnamed protein product [Periconia digitata]|uniref:Uncharacterized protein n=1 Tax=Periconia digitata TaxID=1303443 RepID=A0A9W4XPJ2_9PLEO|nr:unnamed protein product [Periconia digitata]